MDVDQDGAVLGTAFTPEDDKRWEADKEKNAALSHVDRPRSQTAQFDEDYDLTKRPATFFGRRDYPDATVSGYSGSDVVDKSNILKDPPSKYLLNPLAPDVDVPPEALLPNPTSYVAKVVRTQRVTPESHWQDVRLLELAVAIPDAAKGPQVLPGHTLIIYPKNFPSDVRWLIDRMDWAEIADLPVDFALLQPSTPPTRLELGVRPKGLHPVRNGTLRDLLIHNLDITAIPSRTFLEKISHYAGDAREKEKLMDLTKLDNTQEFYDFTSRPRRTILEVLEEFDSVKIPYHIVLDLFPIIRGREFSIASGGFMLKGGRESLHFEVLAALVEYKTVIRKPRQGLCSRYLKHLREGTRIHVGLRTSHETPFDAERKPLIAVATGTGIAPIRSLLYDRNEHSSPPPALLFFGCRNRDADFYFRDEWPMLNRLKVIPAFSRDPPGLSGPPDDHGNPLLLPTSKEHGGTGLLPRDAVATGLLSYDEDQGKNYVQRQIRKHGAQVCALLARGAWVCVCGNSGSMPLEVRRALVEVAVAGNLFESASEAERMLAKRTWMETW